MVYASSPRLHPLTSKPQPSTFLRPHNKTTIFHRTFQTSPGAYDELMDMYAGGRALHSGKKLHAHFIITGLARLTRFAAKLIAFYSGCGEPSYARKLFDQIPVTNSRRWIVLMGAYAQYGFYEEALGLFREMQEHGLRPNEFVIPSTLKACGRVSDRETGEKIHGVVLKCSFESDAFVRSALIDMYSKCGLIEKARRVYDAMVEKDLVALNAMVSGYAQHGFAKEALDLVKKMQALGVKPNVVTWNTLIAGFSQKCDEVMVSELFNLMRSNGVEPDVVSWTSVISGFVQNFRNEEAFATFRKLLDHGFYPKSATISSLLPACATAANVRRGKEIHGYALVIGVGDDIFVRSALVDMYSKCGFIAEARNLFHRMSKRNIVTWNSMIFGYANHGYCNEAIELFNQMEKEEGKKLDHLTFTAVLTACSHAGMVELGQSLFHLMQEKYGIVPRLEHYACMVDLLGRAGKLAEAYDLIMKMPAEPDLFVWGALLGACRNYGNVDLAKVAAKHLSELEPDNAGNNLLLSNLYADAGSWGNVARLKTTMKKRKLRKFPGCSWVEAI
ncbi:pentatricopeptide repeat-containing protein At5g59600-like [Corylus avellana]|uniref:pentatricopeptide repeat-containing protein At5g59600-like n=1 Tax=Corylus avellana TaxID=13451 RepID=UPI001E22824D|nr:pentatricopeptide repeat-containing protein At5g59600-like [Corylus avellana]